jgi:hypothetical protein
MGILIKGNYGTCDSCGKQEVINVIYAGKQPMDIKNPTTHTIEMDLCNDCLKILCNISGV